MTTHFTESIVEQVARSPKLLSGEVRVGGLDREGAK
jgi:hypothetical protein